MNEASKENEVSKEKTPSDVKGTSKSGYQHFVVITPGQSPADALATVDPNATLMESAAERGAVWVKRRKPNGQMMKLARLRNLQESVSGGSELFANINPDVLNANVVAPSLLEQHKNYSFWFKPRGVISQGSKWGDHTAITYLVNKQLGLATHLVHRLDRFACGIMVVAHTRPAVKELAALFAKRQVIKRYQVVVANEWSAPLPYKCHTKLDGSSALTEIEGSLYSEKNQQSTLTVRLHTGRKHQIRQHLASMNFPVVGDKLYGDSRSKASNTNLALMATDLEFQCPFTQNKMHCVVPDHLRKHLLSEP